MFKKKNSIYLRTGIIIESLIYMKIIEKFFKVEVNILKLTILLFLNVLFISKQYLNFIIISPQLIASKLVNNIFKTYFFLCFFVLEKKSNPRLNIYESSVFLSCPRLYIMALHVTVMSSLLEIFILFDVTFLYSA